MQERVDQYPDLVSIKNVCEQAISKFTQKYFDNTGVQARVAGRN